MKCSFICSSFWSYPDREVWFNAIKKIPHSKDTEYPSYEEDKAAQKKLGDVTAYHLIDGTVMIYIDSKKFSNGQSFSDQGYFILSDIEKATEENLKNSIREMEVECLQEGGTIYNHISEKYKKEVNKELVEGHVKCLTKSLIKNAETILRLINER